MRPVADKHADSDPAVSVCFAVSIDGHDLGTFISCEGLGCEVVVEQREEGGNNGYVHQLPTRLKFSNVKLTRPLCGDSAKITDWIMSMAGGPARSSARIEAQSADGRAVSSWTLSEVLPVRWTGPGLSVDTAKVATESLELAHHGFLPGKP